MAEGLNETRGARNGGYRLRKILYRQAGRQVAARGAHKDAGCEKIFTERGSGAEKERSQLAKALEYVREGDVLVVWKLDRLARSTTHLLQIVEELQERSIDFKCLTGLVVDTRTKEGKLMLTIFAGLAEFERELIRERVNAGLAAARAEGRIGGRPRLSEAKIMELRGRIADGQSWRSVAKVMSISQTTISRYLKVDI